MHTQRKNEDVMLSLVVPAYNEAAIIVKTVDELDAYMQSEMPDWSYEVVVVDDGSTDGMAAILQMLERPHLRVVSHARNRGRGAGLQTGFSISRGKYIVTLDADLSYAPFHIKNLLVPLVAGEAAITIASAYHPEGTVKNVPALRAFLSRYGNRVLSAGMQKRFSTVTCIVRGYKAEAIKRLELINNGKDIHIEILQKANLFGYPIVEVPAHLEWHDRLRSKRVGVGRRFPLLSLSSTITSHLIYNYVLRPGSMLVLPVTFLLSVSLIGVLLLAGNWVVLLTDADYGSVWANLYFSLRSTLVQGTLTVAITVTSAIVCLIFLAFYFASHQNKQQFEELYVLLSRANERLKRLEERQED